MHGSRGAPRRQALSVGARRRPIDEAISALLVASVALAAIEVALAVQEEIAHRIEQAESSAARSWSGHVTRPSSQGVAISRSIRTIAGWLMRWKPTGTTGCGGWIRCGACNTTPADAPPIKRLLSERR